MWRRAALAGLAALAAVAPAPSAAAGQGPAGAAPAAPRVVIEAPPELDYARQRLEPVDATRLAGLARLVGLDDPGPPIRVVLASERSDVAARVPDWVAGLALGAAGPVVIFPERATNYPYDSLENVLRHEVTHVLIARAAGGRPVPRWFHEGLAMSAERRWDLGDRGRLVYELTLSRQTGHRELDRLFSGDRRAQERAYALSGALVRDIVEHDGPAAPREMLRAVAGGASFEAAFLQATGTTLEDAEAAFWRRQRIWTIWVPFLTSTTALWMAVTALAVYAMRRRHRQRNEQRERWDEGDEGEEADAR